MSHDFTSGSKRSTLVQAKKSVSAYLAHIKEIPEEAYVNDYFEEMIYIDRLANFLGMPKWEGWQKFKDELRIRGFHKALNRFEHLYQVIALIEKHDKFPKGAGVSTDFKDKKEEELKRKGGTS